MLESSLQTKDGRRELRLRQMLVLGRWVDAGQMLVGCRSCCAAQVALRGLGLIVLPRLCWRAWALGVL